MANLLAPGTLQQTDGSWRLAYVRSLFLAGARTLAEVRDAARHLNVSVSSAYLHVAEDREEGTGELFRFCSAGCAVRLSEVLFEEVSARG